MLKRYAILNFFLNVEENFNAEIVEKIPIIGLSYCIGVIYVANLKHLIPCFVTQIKSRQVLFRKRPNTLTTT